MKGKHKVLMVVSEVAPFAKTGGLGDVGGALPKTLKELGHDVRVITPQYRVTNERKYILRDVIRLQNIEVALGEKKVTVDVKSAFLPNSKVQVYFIDYKPFFSREGLYTDAKSGKDYPDNADRFILFSKGVLETLKKLQWQPDIIHCNDWQSALIPFFLKTIYKDDGFFKKIASLFTIHNFAFQGRFNSDCLPVMGLGNQFQFSGSGLEHEKQCNFLKVGITYADAVNTVSETYAKEVQTSSYGFGLEKAVVARKNDFYGILNGADYNTWDPAVDPLIPERYTMQDLTRKVKNKSILLENQKLPFDETRAVVAMITRLTDQKGLDLVQDVFEEIMRTNIYFVLLGIGEKTYHHFFNKVKKKYKGRIGINLLFDESLSHLIVAGSDILLMPSRFEPCGLTQLYGLKYGTVPVVHATGGLADTVQTFDPKTGKGNGFVFNEMKGKHLMDALKQAVRTFGDQPTWSRVMKNGMKEDFSWQVSAKKYIQLYSRCVSKKK